MYKRQKTWEWIFSFPYYNDIWNNWIFLRQTNVSNTIWKNKKNIQVLLETWNHLNLISIWTQTSIETLPKRKPTSFFISFFSTSKNFVTAFTKFLRWKKLKKTILTFFWVKWLTSIQKQEKYIKFAKSSLQSQQWHWPAEFFYNWLNVIYSPSVTCFTTKITLSETMKK